MPDDYHREQDFSFPGIIIVGLGASQLFTEFPESTSAATLGLLWTLQGTANECSRNIMVNQKSLLTYIEKGYSVRRESQKLDQSFWRDDKTHEIQKGLFEALTSEDYFSSREGPESELCSRFYSKFPSFYSGTF